MVMKRSYLLPLYWSLQTGLFVIWNRGKDCIWVKGMLHHFVIVCAHKAAPILLCLKFSFSWTKNKGLCLVWSHFHIASSAPSNATTFLYPKGSPQHEQRTYIHCVFATVVFLLPTITQVILLPCPSMFFVIINGSGQNQSFQKVLLYRTDQEKTLCWDSAAPLPPPRAHVQVLGDSYMTFSKAVFTSFSHSL